MEQIHLSRWLEGGRRVLRLLGRLDAAAARQLFRRIRDESEREIVVDVVLVREFDEVGVAALARVVESSGDRSVTVRGLSSHQLRLLRYLGAGLSRVAAGSEP